MTGRVKNLRQFAKDVAHDEYSTRAKSPCNDVQPGTVLQTAILGSGFGRCKTWKLRIADL